jgi:hypothetical protein
MLAAYFDIPLPTFRGNLLSELPASISACLILENGICMSILKLGDRLSTYTT